MIGAFAGKAAGYVMTGLVGAAAYDGVKRACAAASCAMRP
jgi:hypothetical protein